MERGRQNEEPEYSCAKYEPYGVRGGVAAYATSPMIAAVTLSGDPAYAGRDDDRPVLKSGSCST